MLVDGVNVRDYKLKALRDKIGYVPQQSFLFKGTIASNVAYGDTDRDDDTVRRACDVAQATEFIDKKQKKYDSGISQGGSNVSGGQKQRLCIARAIAMEPEVILMDEPTSALDPISTNKIEELAIELKKDYTIVIVTHNMQQAARVSDYTAFFLLGEMVEFDKTSVIFQNPKDKRTEDYITGRFG